MAEKHLKKCSTSLVFREMQIKTTLRFYFIPVRISKIKNSGPQMLVRIWRSTPPLLVGLQAGTTTVEVSLRFLRKLGIVLPEDPAIPLLGI